MTTQETTEKFCIDILPKVSRSFALAIGSLKDPLKSYVRTSYLLCRIVDTIEDTPGVPSRKKYFDLFDNALCDPLTSVNALSSILGTTPDETELMTQANLVFSSFRNFPIKIQNQIIPPILEMSYGMSDYTSRFPQGKIKIQNQEELDDYCYYVAGTVGSLITHLFFVESLHGNPVHSSTWLQRQKKRSLHFALALQKVNILKDALADEKRGSRFFPTSWQSQPWEHQCRNMIFQIRHHVHEAWDYIYELDDENQRIFCLWPLLTAIMTLIVALKSNTLLNPSIKVDRPSMLIMMGISKLINKSKTLGRMYTNLWLHRLDQALISNRF